MTGKYRELALDEAVAGMVLAASVLDHQGQVLLPAGATLTEAMLTSMRRRDIASVQLHGEVLTPQQREAGRARIASQLQVLFRRSGRTAADAALLRGLQAYRLEGLE